MTGRGRGAGAGRGLAWAELLRISALFTVPGDALAGAAAVGLRPNRSTALAVGASLCLYMSGMALNDWADREEDARDRPHRPIPSGRISPPAALTAAAGLTLAGLTLSAHAGRRSLAVATALAATVWSYDLHLKHTPAGPLAMATARSLDLLLGATATATGAQDAPAAGSVRGAGAPVAGQRTGTLPRRGVAARARPRSGPAPAGGLLPAAALRAAPDRPRSGSAPADFAARSSRAGGSGVLRTPGVMGGWVGKPWLAGAALPWAGAGAVPSGRPAGPGVRSTTGTQGGWVGMNRPTGGPVSAAGGSGLAPGMGASAWGAAALLGAHTLAVTSVSRHEAHGGSTAVPLGALAVTLALGALTSRERVAPGPGTGPAPRLLATGLAAVYAATAGKPLLHAALNPSPPLTQRAVGGGIRAMIPLQAALAARAGSLRTGAVLIALAPLARKLARKVSPT